LMDWIALSSVFLTFDSTLIRIFSFPRIPLRRAIELAKEWHVYDVIQSLLVENEADLDLEPQPS
jgi:hypothetical protein